MSNQSLWNLKITKKELCDHNSLNAKHELNVMDKYVFEFQK